MRPSNRLQVVATVVTGIAIVFGNLAAQTTVPDTPAAPEAARSAPGRIDVSMLWQDRGDISTLDMIGGPGGRDHMPRGRFTFIEEDMNGTSPKFEVSDEDGVRWKVKMGEEVKSETAATRLVWAAGYYTDEDYYLPEIHVDKMPAKLERGGKYVSPDGTIRDVRMERKLKGQKKDSNWSWFDNPLVGTKELNGLKVMMALIDNWDLKEINNAVYDEKKGGYRYVVSDLGASFGKTGNSLTRSKSDPKDYVRSKFVQKIAHDHVDFYMSSRPFILSAVDVSNYMTRTHMQQIVKDIPIADVRWIARRLTPLTDEQLRDCFRAGGYSKEEVEMYSGEVKARIIALSRI